MPFRPPLVVTRRTVLAALLAILLVTSSLAAGASTTTSTAPGDNPPQNTTAPGGHQPHNAAVTCTFGNTGSTSSRTADENLSISTWTAPASASGNLQTGDALRKGIESGILTPVEAGANRYDRTAVAIGDGLVHRIQLNGSTNDLLDRLDDQSQGSPTENFHALVQRDDNGIDFRYIGPTACPPELALNASIENESFRVVPDRDHDTLYLVVDVEELRFELGSSGPTADKWNWGHHALSLTFRESSGLVAENTSIRDHYDVDRRRVEFESEHDSFVRFSAEPNQTLAGSASMAPGTTFQIELVPLGNPNASAAYTTNATLDREGEFNATFDLSDAPDDTLYTIRIPTTPRDDAPRRIVAVENAIGASLGANDHESIGTVLYANGVTTTDGGFLAARNDTTTVAVSEHFGPGYASPQPHYDPLLWQDETLTLTVYHDTNGNGAFDPATDEPYRRGGEPVQSTVNVSVDLSEREQVATTTTTVTTTPTPTSDSTTSTTTGGSARTETHPDKPVHTPGFGVLAAFIALVGVALLARHR